MCIYYNHHKGSNEIMGRAARIYVFEVLTSFDRCLHLLTVIAHPIRIISTHTLAHTWDLCYSSLNKKLEYEERTNVL